MPITLNYDKKIVLFLIFSDFFLYITKKFRI